MIDLLIACFLGILIGSITGIFPGIHVNTSGAIVFTLSPYLLQFTSSEVICVFLASLAISHAILEFIPSTLLGVPDEGTALSILPGHRMVLEGRAKEAIRIVAIGGFGAIIVTILTLPLFAIILPGIHEVSKPYLWIFLLIVSIILIYRLSHNLKEIIWSFILFIFSGIIGWTIFETPIPSNLSLMATFTGLFGISTIIFSINDNSHIPHQNPFVEIELDRNSLKNIILGGTTGGILGFLPGFGPAQGGIIAQDLTNSSDKDNTTGFLMIISGINTSDCLFSLISIYLIGNPRSGIAVFISYIINDFTIFHLLLFIFTSLIAVSIGLSMALIIGDRFSKFIEGINYGKISYISIGLMISIVYIFTFVYHGPVLYISLILITSTALGLLPHFQGLSKSHLMGVLIIPAIVIYYQMFH